MQILIKKKFMSQDTEHNTLTFSSIWCVRLWTSIQQHKSVEDIGIVQNLENIIMNQTSEVRAFNKFTGTGGREPKNSANSALKWCLPRHGHIIKGKENSYTGKPYQSLLVFSIKTLSTQKNE